MSAQLVSMLVMFISGIAVGAVIDCTRSILSQLPFKGLRKITLLIEWVIWLFLGLCTFYFLFLIKGGNWRVVDPLAQIAGIVMYEFVFQKAARLGGRILVNILIRPFFYVGHLFVRLIRGILRLLVAIIVFLSTPIRKIYKKTWFKTFQKKN